VVPDVAKKGHSFKGAFAYYLHDKRQGEGPHPDTAERVAWTETRNLITDDPHTAKRIMIATASQADELKAQAGVKATGRKSTAHVYAYSLSWHPDEAATLDRAEMVRAADASLKVLGADHLQAVIVAHTDRGHPHVHVIVNRVDPNTGRMHGFQNDHRQLDAWAKAYEEARGRILTPKRHERERDAARSDDLARPSPKPDQPREPSRAAKLAQDAAAMKDAHKQAWADLSADHKAKHEAAWKDRPSFKDIIAQHKADTRAEWSAFGKTQAAERRAFHAAEKTLVGTVSNAISAAKFELRGAPSERGLLGKAFKNTLDRDARHAAFTAFQATDKEHFSADMKARLDAKIEAAKAGHAAKMDAVRTAHTTERATLKAKQDGERAQVRQAWRDLYAEREKSAALDAARDQSRNRMTWRSGQNFKHGRRMDRSHAAAQSVAARQEKPAMDYKRQWDDAQKRKDHAPPAPTRTVSAPTPAPAPSPSGEVPRPSHAPQNVPKVDRAADWAKTAQGQRVVSQQTQKAAPDSLRSRAPADYRPPATPAQPKVGPDQQTPTPTRKDWTKAAEQPKAEPKQDWTKASDRRQTPRDRAKDKDRDFDRER
jgi:hypothetical protein